MSENALVLGQYACDVKSNEITAIPELLKLFDIKGAVISIDALGCQKTFHVAADKGHGRNELRRVWVQREVDWLSRSEEWPGLQSLVSSISALLGLAPGISARLRRPQAQGP